MVEEVAQSSPVFDLGTGSRFRKEIAPYRDMLMETGYYALGYHVRRQGELTPDLDADLQSLPFRTGSVGGAFAIEVFEHLPHPWKAAEELHWVLRPGGKALVTVPFQTGYHGVPGPDGYEDYFRYSESGLKSLLGMFKKVEVVPVGGKLYRLIHTPPFLFLRGPMMSRALVGAFNAIDARQPPSSPLRWLALVER